jgi:hypothetical protein
LRTILLAGILGPHLIVPVSFAQGGSGGGNKGGNTGGGNNSPSTPGNSQGSQQPSANNQGPSAPGITGGGSGSIAIESVLFAYKALAKDAENISENIEQKVKGKIVVVATPADFASFLQWRTTMYQAALLDKRAQSAIAAVKAAIPPSFANVPKSAQTVGGAAGPFLGSPSDVQTLIQTLASMFAVNQTVSASSGSLTSTPLTNLLAAKLRKQKANAYVPAVYPSNLLQNAGLEKTFIKQRLDKLEEDRRDAVAAAEKYAQALQQANTILSGSASSYTPGQKTDASNFKQNYGAASELSSAIAAIDNFESTLLTGQPAAPSAQANGQGQQQQTNQANGPQATPNVGTPAAGAPPAGPAQRPAPPVGTPASPNPTGQPTTPGSSPGPSNPSGANGSNPATPTYPSTVGAPLQQMLASDLLAHQIWAGKEPDEAAQMDNIVILVVQTLESGGDQMTKSNLFLGSRIYFNGGAVATFALYGIDGVLQCGGFAYAYGGYSKDADFGDALKRHKLDPTGEIESNCEP